MLQLLDHNISMFNMKTGKYIDVNSVIERIGVSPDKFVDYLALQGDPGDNVPGIPGIGPKTAMQLIRRYGSIKNLFCCLGELSDRHRNNLREFENRLFLSKKLVTIDCNVPVEIDYGKFAMKDFDKDRLKNIFNELGFSRLIVQLGLENKEQY